MHKSLKGSLTQRSVERVHMPIYESSITGYLMQYAAGEHISSFTPSVVYHNDT